MLTIVVIMLYYRKHFLQGKTMKKLYYIVESPKTALGAISEPLLSSVVMTEKSSQNIALARLKKENPNRLFMPSWQWKNKEGMDEILKLNKNELVF